MSTNFSPTPAELTLVSQIFAKADPQKLGILTGDVAVRIFGGAKLAPVTLGEIWNIADEDNNGWLSRKGVAMAIRLIGWAQKGEQITQSLLSKPGPLPVIEGITAIPQQNTGMSLSKSPPPQAFPPLTPQDKAKFDNMFFKSGAVNGMLTGEKARDVFVKSKLSNEQLMKIWNLADTQDRGSLDAADFAIGMYFIQGVMAGRISFIPTSLPPGLYQQAGGISSTPSLQTHTTGTSGSFSPIRSGFAPQLTGQTPMVQAHNTGMSMPFGAPALPARPSAFPPANGHSNDWDVTAAEKASADRYFVTLDPQKRGYIEGDVAVPFMLKSQLPGEVLAQVWDLADINNDGRLTRDGFAIAMHLIQKKLGGQEVPATLPTSLIPPALRSLFNSQSPFSPATSQFQQPQPETVDDLFSFDDTPPPSTVQTHAHQPSSILRPQATGPLASPPARAPGARPVESDPFSAPFHSSNQDFLGDDDHHGIAVLSIHDQSAEIGNVRNQLQSTEKSLSAAKLERQTLEQTLADQASQLSTQQTQLSSAKAAYETETSLLTTLKERRSAQLAQMQTAREELIRAESDLSAVRVEKAEIEGVFLRDKEEARDLHKRMIETGQQVEALKAEVEKLKKEAKQQKGLLAIARKQLSTKETERSKVGKEHEEAVAELTSLDEEKAVIEADIAKLDSSPFPQPRGPLSPSDSVIFAASQPLPATPDPSQRETVRSNSNNPFERLALASGTPTPRSQSPFLGLQNTVISSPPAFINGNILPPGGIVQAPAEGPQEAGPKPADGVNNDSSYLQGDLHSKGPEGIFSPSTDYFVTPPTSANGHDLEAEVATSKFPALEDTTPSVDPPPKPASPLPATQTSLPQTSTDLNSQLRELDVEGSETDSDSDEESEEGAPAPTVNGNGNAAPLFPASDADKSVATPDASLPVSPPALAPVADVSFDDIFGSTETRVKEPKQSTTPFDAFISPPVNVGSSKAPESTSHVAGVAEFDQALGNIPPSIGATPVNFSFDDAFEDNFDFASAKAVDFPPSIDSLPEADKSKQQPMQPAQSTALDTIFGSSTPSAPTSLQTPHAPLENGSSKPDSSFDEVFSGFDTVTSPKLDDKPAAAAASAQTTTPAIPTSSNEGSIPGAFPSQPSSPVASPPRIDGRAASAAREKSPPPRVASPKPRVSSSSSKETHDKPKDPPPRHSKLSIRLPFGKKKKQPEPMPPPSQLLTPPVEEPHRATTPANVDDVESVKQLTSMGFSRGQAVDALEKYDYDVQRALNNLLGGTR